MADQLDALVSRFNLDDPAGQLAPGSVVPRRRSTDWGAHLAA
jgi:hypothetical protein